MCEETLSKSCQCFLTCFVVHSQREPRYVFSDMNASLALLLSLDFSALRRLTRFNLAPREHIPAPSPGAVTT